MSHYDEQRERADAAAASAKWAQYTTPMDVRREHEKTEQGPEAQQQTGPEATDAR